MDEFWEILDESRTQFGEFLSFQTLNLFRSCHNRQISPKFGLSLLNPRTLIGYTLLGAFVMCRRRAGVVGTWWRPRWGRATGCAHATPAAEPQQFLRTGESHASLLRQREWTRYCCVTRGGRYDGCLRLASLPCSNHHGEPKKWIRHHLLSYTLFSLSLLMVKTVLLVRIVAPLR